MVPETVICAPGVTVRVWEPMMRGVKGRMGYVEVPMTNIG